MVERAFTLKVLVTFVFDQSSHCLGHSNLLSCVSLRILEKLIIWYLALVLRGISLNLIVVLKDEIHNLMQSNFNLC